MKRPSMSCRAPYVIVNYFQPFTDCATSQAKNRHFNKALIFKKLNTIETIIIQNDIVGSVIILGDARERICKRFQEAEHCDNVYG